MSSPKVLQRGVLHSPGGSLSLGACRRSMWSRASLRPMASAILSIRTTSPGDPALSFAGEGRFDPSHDPCRRSPLHSDPGLCRGTDTSRFQAGTSIRPAATWPMGAPESLAGSLAWKLVRWREGADTINERDVRLTCTRPEEMGSIVRRPVPGPALHLLHVSPPCQTYGGCTLKMNLPDRVSTMAKNPGTYNNRV